MVTTTPKAGRPIALASHGTREARALDALARAVGGVSSLAAVLGVSQRTINAWAAGERQPHRLARRAVAQVAVAHGVAPPWPVD